LLILPVTANIQAPFPRVALLAQRAHGFETQPDAAMTRHKRWHRGPCLSTGPASQMLVLEVGISKTETCQSDGYKIAGCFALYPFKCDSRAQRPLLGLCEWGAVEKRPPGPGRHRPGIQAHFLATRLWASHLTSGHLSPLGCGRKPLHGPPRSPSA